MTGRTVTKHVEWIKNNSELKWARLKGMGRISDKVIPVTNASHKLPGKSSLNVCFVLSCPVLSTITNIFTTITMTNMTTMTVATMMTMAT